MQNVIRCPGPRAGRENREAGEKPARDRRRKEGFRRNNVTVRYGMGRRAGVWTSEPEDLPDDGYCRKGAENPDGDGQNAGRMMKRSGTGSGVPPCCLFLSGWKGLFLFSSEEKDRCLRRAGQFCAPPFPAGPVKKKEEFL